VKHPKGQRKKSSFTPPHYESTPAPEWAPGAKGMICKQPQGAMLVMENLMSNLSSSLAQLNVQRREARDTGATAGTLCHPKAG